MKNMEKLDAICDAIDFIRLAMQEIEEYNSLSDIVDELDDLCIELQEEYDETRDKVQELYEEEYGC